VQARQLDEEDRALYKGRIAGMLQPGETVLQALRRLANMQQQEMQEGRGRHSHGQGQQHRHRGGREAHAMGGPGEVGGGDDDDEDDDPSENVFTLQQQGRSGERQRQKKLLKQQQQQQQQQPTNGSNAAPAFNQAGECSDQGLVQGHMETASLGTAAGAPQAHGNGSAARGGPPSSSLPHPAPAQQQRQSTSQRLGPDRRVPVENSIEFEKLTEYADLLLGQVGQEEVYWKGGMRA
jgi:hypothetical protein